MASRAAELLRPFRNDFLYYAPRALKIQTKQGQLVRFMPNKAQLHAFQVLTTHWQRGAGKVRARILKARQEGISTLIQAWFYWLVSGQFAKNAFILTHLQDATDHLFSMTARFHEHCPPVLKPSTSAASAKELYFDKLGSGYSVATAGSRAAGRSRTIQYFHGCLAEGSLVVDGLDGSLRPIEAFEVGDFVMTHTGAVAPVSFISTQEKECLSVVFHGLPGLPLEATREHRFWTPSGWRELGELGPGDEIGFPLPRLDDSPQHLAVKVVEPARRQGGGRWKAIDASLPATYELGRVLGAYGETRVEGGYAWVRIKRVEGAGQRRVYDFEVDHEDHSYCTVHGATHNSEVAFWPNAEENMAGIGQAVADMPGTVMILESTANGIGDVFHQGWQASARGESEYVNIFIPWYWMDEYRHPVPDDFEMEAEEQELAEAFGLDAGQILFRRRKIADDFNGDVSYFDQEYPATPEMAFRRTTGQVLVPIMVVERARKHVVAPDEMVGPKIMGIDPAEYGDDSTVFAMRQGRCWPRDWYERYHGRGPMEVVGLALRAIERWDPDVVCVDATGLGSGIADRIAEQTSKTVVRVLFGERAIQNELYVLRRDEMWGDMKEWFEDQPNQVPDDDSVQSDICSQTYTHDSSRRLKLTAKERMKADGLKSPDAGDAFALTFAVKGSAWGSMKVDPDRRSNWRTI